MFPIPPHRIDERSLNRPTILQRNRGWNKAGHGEWFGVPEEIILRIDPYDPGIRRIHQLRRPVDGGADQEIAINVVFATCDRSAVADRWINECCSCNRSPDNIACLLHAPVSKESLRLFCAGLWRTDGDNDRVR